MSDLRDKYGKVVYRVQGDRICDIYGNLKYTIVGDRIIRAYGDWKYTIRGDYIYDTHGNRLGEKKNLADILGPSDSIGDTEISDDGPRGCLGALVVLLVFMFKANWGGRIGIAIGIIMMIVTLNDGETPGENAVLFGIVMIFVCGLVGAGIGSLVKKKTIIEDNVSNEPIKYNPLSTLPPLPPGHRSIGHFWLGADGNRHEERFDENGNRYDV